MPACLTGSCVIRGTTLHFEVVGKWMGRYTMWQLELANDICIPNGGILGPSELKFDPHEELWEYVSDDEPDDDDDF